MAPTQGQLLNYVQRVPLGVVAQITVRILTSLSQSRAIFSALLCSTDSICPLTNSISAFQSPTSNRHKEDRACIGSGEQRSREAI